MLTITIIIINICLEKANTSEMGFFNAQNSR